MKGIGWERKNNYLVNSPQSLNSSASLKQHGSQSTEVCTYVLEAGARNTLVGT